MDKRPKVGLGIFVLKDNKFIMGCRKGAHGEGTWSVPGGHLEYGESIEQGSAREVFEETGLKIKDIHIAGVTNDVFGKEGKHYITIWTVSRWQDGAEKITEPDKFLELGWYDFDRLPNPLFLPWQQLLKSEFVESIKKQLM